MRLFTLTLMLAVLLPLQAYAAAGGCAPESVAAGTTTAHDVGAIERSATGPVTHVVIRTKRADPAEGKQYPTALALQGAILRGSPTLSTPDIRALAAGSVIKLRAPFKNNDGSWWYVSVDGIGAGWVALNHLTDFRAAGAPPRAVAAPEAQVEPKAEAKAEESKLPAADAAAVGADQPQ